MNEHMPSQRNSQLDRHRWDGGKYMEMKGWMTLQVDGWVDTKNRGKVRVPAPYSSFLLISTVQDKDIFSSPFPLTHKKTLLALHLGICLAETPEKLHNP